MNIIDSHFHWYPRAYFELLRGRAESPRTERKGSTYRYWWAKDKGVADMPPIWLDLEEEFSQMDKTGHHIGVLNSAGVLATDLAALPLGLTKDVCDACNNEFAKMQNQYRGRFWASAFVPFQNPEAAVEVLDHAVKRLGLYGANLPSSVNGEGLDHPRFEPFYARAAELGAPLFIHASDSDLAQLLMEGHGGMVHAGLGRPFESSLATLRLILAGVMERHRKLKIILFHIGGVLPYMAGRLDKNSHVKGLREPPSHYISQLYTDTVSPAPLALKMAIDFFGVDRVMYGSDFPCWSPEAALRVLDEMNLSITDKEKVLFRNVVGLFGLKVLEPAA